MEWLKEILEGCENADELFKSISGKISEIYSEKGSDEEKGGSEEVEQLKKEIASIKNEFAIEKEIMAQGGKNTRAIRALIEEGMIEFNEKGEICAIDLEEIKKSAPYLFKEIKNVIEGTPENKGKKAKKENGSFLESAKKAAGIRK